MSRAPEFLILGGTRDARELAGLLIARGADVTSSLAGRTQDPVKPEGKLRVGGFGGADGLAEYLRAHHYDAVIDATHPYAAQISAHAAEAAARLGIRHLRLERPQWRREPGDKWLEVPCMGAASDALLPGARVLLTTGLKDLPSFFSRPDLSGIARMMGEPALAVPPQWRLIRERPPFSLESELALMGEEGITVLVTKNAGGPARAKLDAARQLGLAVVMITRPQKPAAEVAASAEELVRLLF